MLSVLIRIASMYAAFVDFLDAECSNPLIAKVKNWNFAISPLFFWLQQTQTETFISLKQSGNYTQTFFFKLEC